jgi:hypothetical protein
MTTTQQYLWIIAFCIGSYLCFAGPLWITYQITQWWKRHRKGSQTYLPFPKQFKADQEYLR